MAEGMLYREAGAKVRALVNLYAEVAIGAAGAPTLDAAKSRGIASIKREGAGDYTITLDGPYQRLLTADVKFVVASGLPASPVAFIRSSTATTVRIVLTKLDTPAATDPASGETMLLALTLANGS